MEVTATVAFHNGHLDCQNELVQKMFDELDDYIKSLNFTKYDPFRKGHLIQVLHKAQEIFGYLPEEVQIFVAKKLNLHLSEVSGVISFYNFFSTTPKGKHKINICLGTACFVKGASKILEEFTNQLGIGPQEVTEDMEFSIDIVRCVGACGLAPVVTVGDRVYAKVTTGDVEKIIKDCKES